MLRLWWSVMFSMMEKTVQSGPDSIIRRWIPELSSGFSAHKLEQAWLCFQAIIFLALRRPARGWKCLLPSCDMCTQLLNCARQRRAGCQDAAIPSSFFFQLMPFPKQPFSPIPSLTVYLLATSIWLSVYGCVCMRFRGEGQQKLGRDAVLLSHQNFPNPFLILTWG